MDYHPFAEPWPLMIGAPFDKLVADIKANGLLMPIITYQGMILDGRNRHRACVAAGVEPRYQESTATDDRQALKVSASFNEHRRHLSLGELAFIAESLATLLDGQRADQMRQGVSIETPASENQMISRDEAATVVGTTLTNLNRARAVRRYAPELEADVKAGKLKLSRANDIALERGLAKRRSAPPTRGTPRGPALRKPDVPRRTRVLTPEDVDPEFTGTPGEFTTEYGHVQIMTSLERSTSTFGDWAIIIGHLARELRKQQPPKVTPIVLSWLRTPKAPDVERMRTALTEIEEAVRKARALLARAEEASPASVAPGSAASPSPAPQSGPQASSAPAAAMA